jgi:transcription antitermination protein NusB
MKGSSRRRSRELALQALYQWLLNATDADELVRQSAEAAGYEKADRQYLEALVRGTIAGAPTLSAALQPFLDRKIENLSPVEHALLLMAAHELTAQLETPYKVILNEAVELAKSYGGTDGHKYVNGVLDRLAVQVRPEEVKPRGARSLR